MVKGPTASCFPAVHFAPRTTLRDLKSSSPHLLMAPTTGMTTSLPLWVVVNGIGVNRGGVYTVDWSWGADKPSDEAD